MTRVLFAEDEPDIAELIQEGLTAAGFEATGFPDGDKLLAAAKASPPDLILLDINMPGLTGWQVRELLLAEPSTAKVPVIGVSARGGAGVEFSATQSMAFADFVRKPFRMSDLVARAKKAIGAP